MAKVGVRELKSRLSYYLTLVRGGERVVVTDRGVPVAELGPLTPKTEEEALRALVTKGLATWGGGKPQGAMPRAHVTGRPVSEILLEERGEPLPGRERDSEASAR